ncbi:MAG TPA: hypothetical protein VLF40_03795, partial [Candidatus Saccharimonadales bacterium]|nr:hypothetical protein [Candidatus Saccharimonadales bacterium]
AAERAGRSIKLSTLAELDHGDSQPDVGRRQRKSLRTARDIILGDVLAERAEEAKGFELADWLTGVAKEDIHLVSETATDEQMFEPLSLVAGEKRFDLGLHFNFNLVTPELARLPEAVRSHLLAKRAYWQPFGIENATQLEAFIDKHFEHFAVDFTEGAKRPAELDWLETNEPEAYRQLKARQHAGDTIVLRRMKQTPEQVLEGTKRLAVHTQRKFYTTWLPQLMLTDANPLILESDRAALQTLHDEYVKALGSQYNKGKLDLFMYQLLRDQTVNRLEQDIRFEDGLAMLRRVREIGLGIEVIPGDDHDLDSVTADSIRAINVALQDGLGDEYALRKIMHDAAHSDSESMLKIMRFIPLFVGLAYGLENVPIDWIARSAKVAGAGDDLLMEGSIIVAMLGKGFKPEDIRKRLLPIATTAIAAAGVGTQIDLLTEHAGAHVAALVYALTTVATSSMSHILNARSLAKDYDILVREGKVPGRQSEANGAGRAALDEALQAALEGEQSHEAIMDSLRPVMEKMLQDAGMSPRKIQSAMQTLAEMIRDGQTENALEVAQVPGAKERYTAAVKDLLDTNPTYRWIIASILASPVVAAGLGSWLLALPFVYVPYGTAESVGGMAGAAIDKHTFYSRWDSRVRGKIQPAL